MPDSSLMHPCIKSFVEPQLLGIHLSQAVMHGIMSTLDQHQPMRRIRFRGSAVVQQLSVLEP